MSNGTPLTIGHFAKLAGSVIANLPREMDSQLALDFAGNGDALEIILAEALTRANLGRALIALGKKAEPKPLPPILRFGGTIVVPARPMRFVVNKSYVVNTDPGSHVKLGYVDRDFIAAFGDGVEEPTAETTLRYDVLARPSAFAPAIKELHDVGVVTGATPGELFSLMEKQPDGSRSPAGALLTDGYANLFEVVCGAVSRLVSVHWPADIRGWSVYSGPVAGSSRWLAGDRVFSCNSRGQLVA
jgi:hypothetical protein